MKDQTKTRTEIDSMGAMQAPEWALYGAQTARAAENFPISGLRFSKEFMRALALIKKHGARVNFELGLLEESISGAIQEAAREVMDGKWDEHFVVDIFQTGSGTSTHMNMNEVLAKRATLLLGGGMGDQWVHPNDHVNRGQSSNDVFPSAIHVAALRGITGRLLPALEGLEEALRQKSAEFQDVIKIGRTHLQDATPLRLGQEFSGYASQLAHGIRRLRNARTSLEELALGGTAVGTGMNTHPEFARRVIEGMNVETGLNLREAGNHFEAQGARDAAVEASGALKTAAVSLAKIANDLRWLGSGPRCGLGELKLPATQPGSSIMPGKVNPVMCEMLMQTAAQVVGNDGAITVGGLFGNLELNVMMPVIARNLLESIELLAAGSRVFADRCVKGLEADRGRCADYLEKSFALATALAPVIGYDQAARIAKRAQETGRTVRETALEMSSLTEAELNLLLDARRQTEPGAGGLGANEASDLGKARS